MMISHADTPAAYADVDRVMRHHWLNRCKGRAHGFFDGLPLQVQTYGTGS